MCRFFWTSPTPLFLFEIKFIEVIKKWEKSEYFEYEDSQVEPALIFGFVKSKQI